MEPRQKKRILIIFIYIAIFAGLAFLAAKSFSPGESCFDGKKNQNEEGVDCGGVCLKCEITQAKDLIVRESGFVESGTLGVYDVWAVVENPNHILGGESFDYEFFLKNSQGEIISKRNGSSFVLPGEKKYIIETNLPSGSLPDLADVSLGKPVWKEFTDHFERPDLSIVNRNYNEIVSGTGFAEAKGLLKNRSSFDFSMIKIKGVLKNSRGEVVAVNSTEMRTVKSGEERDFRLFWPNRFPGEVANFEAQAEVNVFSSDAFMKIFFREHPFQSYR